MQEKEILDRINAIERAATDKINALQRELDKATDEIKDVKEDNVKLQMDVTAMDNRLSHYDKIGERALGAAMVLTCMGAVIGMNIDKAREWTAQWVRHWLLP